MNPDTVQVIRRVVAVGVVTWRLFTGPGGGTVAVVGINKKSVCVCCCFLFVCLGGGGGGGGGDSNNLASHAKLVHDTKLFASLNCPSGLDSWTSRLTDSS